VSGTTLMKTPDEKALNGRGEPAFVVLVRQWTSFPAFDRTQQGTVVTLALGRGLPRGHGLATTRTNLGVFVSTKRFVPN
jgi:hypothetical protein